jgi:ATP-dependent Zn protease
MEKSYMMGYSNSFDMKRYCENMLKSMEEIIKDFINDHQELISSLHSKLLVEKSIEGSELDEIFSNKLKYKFEINIEPNGKVISKKILLQ